MGQNSDDARLDQISTRWTLLKRAHQGDEDMVAVAQAQLLDRYGGAIRRYLLGALRDQEAVADLFQEFAYRFLHGDFRGACQEKGRFRDFLKGVVSHLVADFSNRRKRLPMGLPENFPEPEAAPNLDMDRLFQESWRDELLSKTWQKLEEAQQETGQPFYTVLRFRANHPELRSPELASQLSEKLEKPLTAPGVRQLLHRAREKFAELLRAEVRESISSENPEDLEQELQDLGLAGYLK
jgi:DNA-directed RNA polymerase specialized sigma24 family protein